MDTDLYVIYDTVGIYADFTYGGKTTVLDNVDDDLKFTNEINIGDHTFNGALYSTKGDYERNGDKDMMINVRFVKHVISKQPDILIVLRKYAYLVDAVKPTCAVVLDMAFIEEDKYKYNVIKNIFVNGNKYYERPSNSKELKCLSVLESCLVQCITNYKQTVKKPTSCKAFIGSYERGYMPRCPLNEKTRIKFVNEVQESVGDAVDNLLNNL